MGFDCFPGCGRILNKFSKFKPTTRKSPTFEPELRGREIVLPVEFAKEDGQKVTLGFTLDKEHLRDLFSAYEFDEIVGG